MSGSIAIREVKEILEACFTKEEWLKVKDQRQDEIINRVTRICENIRDNAEATLAMKVMDFLKRWK